MKESKIKLSLDDFKELIDVTEKNDGNLLNINEVTPKDNAIGEETTDWSSWFKAIYGR